MSMKKILTGILAVAALSGIQAFAQDDAPEMESKVYTGLKPSEISVNTQFKSRYLSDGRVINPDYMLFGSVTLGWDLKDTEDFCDGLYIGIWGANDLNRYNAGSGIKYEPEEFDYYIGYWYTLKLESDNFENLNFDLSYTYWDYPSRTGWEYVGSQQNTIALDINTGIKNEKLDSLKPGVTINWDPENEKYYANIYVKAADTFWTKDDEDEKKKQTLGWNSSLELMWGNSHYVDAAFIDVDGTNDIHKNTFTTLTWKAGLDYSPMKNMSIGPFVQLSFALDHECRDSWKLDDNSKSGVNNLWGFGASFKF